MLFAKDARDPRMIRLAIIAVYQLYRAHAGFEFVKRYCTYNVVDTLPSHATS